MSTVLWPSPVFGPFHSRRLGRSLGVNLMPADGKVCNFDCVYCECGLNAAHRPRLRMPGRAEVRAALRGRLEELVAAGTPPDSITFSGNGEPTGHPEFPGVVRDTVALRDAICPGAIVTVLTNATRIGQPEILSALLSIDKPCVKLDTVDADYIGRVDRPTGHYDIARVLEAAARFGGRCFVQSMFLKGTVGGIDVDNTGDRYVLPWLDALRRIRPEGVDIYTVARETPLATLRKASAEEIDRIVALVRAEGLDAHGYY